MRRKRNWQIAIAVVGSALAAAATLRAGHALAGCKGISFLDELEAAPAVTVSTVATTGTQVGDNNPYGVAVVPVNEGKLRRGHVLVSDFNAVAGLQATGSSIVQIDPVTSTQSLFFDAGAPLGLTTALEALRSGVVVVGFATLVSSTPPTVDNGGLLFIDAEGHLLLTLTDAKLRGPWDMAANDTDPDRPQLFVSNVLSGTVVRIDLRIRRHDHDCDKEPRVHVESITTIASGFATRTDPAALVVGPTGLAWDRERDELFVADTGNNRIAELDDVSDRHTDQGAGSTVFAGPPLQGPLGLALTPHRHLIAANGDAQGTGVPFNTVVELTRAGKVVAQTQLDTGTAGALFGIAITEFQGEPSLVWVDDNSFTLNITKTR
jgi:DNA-binding beta-propeller fold protein YncE